MTAVRHVTEPAAGGIDYGLLGADGLDELLAFYLRIYPTLGWSPEFMRWQYGDNPAGHARTLAARRGGVLVGSYTAIPLRLYVDGETCPGHRVQDVITDPGCRGMGIYRRLTEQASKTLMQPDHPLNFAFPNENSHKMFVNAGWTCPNRVPLWQCGAMGPAAHDAGWTARPIQAFDRRHEAIWVAHRRQVRYAIDRGVAFLNWRYQDNPRGGYLPFLLSDGERSAVTVLKLFDRDDGARVGHLVDWFADSHDAETAQAVVSHYAGHAYANGCTLATCWHFAGGPLDSALRGHGFALQADITRWHMLNWNRAEAAPVSDPDNWHVAMGDSDVY